MKNTTNVIVVLFWLYHFTNNVVVLATVYTGSYGENVIWELDANRDV